MFRDLGRFPLEAVSMAAGLPGLGASGADTSCWVHPREPGLGRSAGANRLRGRGQSPEVGVCADVRLEPRVCGVLAAVVGLVLARDG